MWFAERGISYDVIGSGPPVLLLHGFPQTRAMWAPVAERLAAGFTVVSADLRGYGASAKPDAADLASYSFRAMAADQVALMRSLGFGRFALVGHDRGARVGHRMALDAPEAVSRLALLDIVPTRHLLEGWNIEVATAYWHWTWLAQPAPFPETVIGHDPDGFFEACLLGWGGAALSDFPALDDYRAAWRDPAAIAGMCADYRATLFVDRALDAADAGRRVGCPALVLYGADGAMARLYDVAATWRDHLADLRAEAMPGGHFLVDQAPGPVAETLAEFLGMSPR